MKAIINVLFLFFLCFFFISCEKQELTFGEDLSDKEESIIFEQPTQLELDNKLKQQLDTLNTPSSEYPFFKQLESGWKIEEIISAWGMEITHGNIYTTWLSQEFTFLNDYLSKTQKKYSFTSKSNWYSMVYWEEDDFKRLLSNLKQQFVLSEYNKVDEQHGILQIWDGNITYTLDIFKPTLDSRDDIDTVLSLNNMYKILLLNK